MNCTKLPKHFCEDINKTNRTCFWNNNIGDCLDKKTIYTIAWDKICPPKRERSLGIRKLKVLMLFSLQKDDEKFLLSLTTMGANC